MGKPRVKAQAAKKQRKQEKKQPRVSNFPTVAGPKFAAIEYAATSLEGITDKKGFEAYQTYRDFLVEVFAQPDKAKLFVAEDRHYELIKDFQLFDPAYIDNVILSITLRVKAPEVYAESVKIIDRHVRPKKQNEGFNHLYQDCGGFLAMLLQHYEGISHRQSVRAAAQLTRYSASTIEKSCRRKQPLRKNLKEELPPPLTLTALYWTLHNKGIDPDSLAPFKNKSVRSLGESRKVVAAYWRLTERIIRDNHEKVMRQTHGQRLTLLNAIGESSGLSFPLPESKLNKPDALTVFFVTGAAMLFDMMPDVIDGLIEKLTSMV